MRSKSVIFILSIFMLSVLLIGCQASSNDEKEEITNEDIESENEEVEVPEKTGKTPIVTLTMENGEDIVMELYPDKAPNTVNNFITLVNDGFYDGLIFHRAIPGFMIQGGDPEGTGMGGPGYEIKGEFQNNGFKNDLIHERGVVPMARTNHPDSAGSQFFIMTDEAKHLDNDYAAFGKVTEGMETVDEIVSVETDKQDKPKEDQVIESATVELEGYEVQEPEIIE